MINFLTKLLSEKNMHVICKTAITVDSFVTKNNFDIEEQIADLYTYGVKCKYLKEFAGIFMEKESYESRIIAALENKLFQKPDNAGLDKMKHYLRMNSFQIFK